LTVIILAFASLAVEVTRVTGGGGGRTGTIALGGAIWAF